MIDLHTHSIVSDGSDPPERVVELAAAAGCSAMALTDHDSLAGIARARERAAALGVTFVPGCEVSCVPVASGGMHVLVYFVEDDGSPLGAELARLREDRRHRNLTLADRLAELGVPVTFPMAAARAGSEEGTGRPHFAAAMVEVGAVSSIDEAFDRYLGNGGPAFIPKARLSAAEVASSAAASGGVAVLAHPYSLGVEGRELADVVEDLAGAGFAGLEVTYGRYSPRQRTELGHLARRFGLVATGGSDYHGTAKPDLAVGTGQGDLRVPDRVLEELAARRPHGRSVGDGGPVVEQVGQPPPP